MKAVRAVLVGPSCIFCTTANHVSIPDLRGHSSYPSLGSSRRWSTKISPFPSKNSHVTGRPTHRESQALRCRLRARPSSARSYRLTALRYKRGSALHASIPHFATSLLQTVERPLRGGALPCFTLGLTAPPRVAQPFRTLHSYHRDPS